MKNKEQCYLELGINKIFNDLNSIANSKILTKSQKKKQMQHYVEKVSNDFN